MRMPILAAAAALSTALAARGDSVESPRPAPNCALSALRDAEHYEVRQFRGEVLWLDFWASWCAPCAEALPFLDDLQKEFGARGLVVLAVNLDEEPAAAEAFLDRHPVGLRLGADPAGTCPRLFGVEAMPAAYLIDRRGFIRGVHLGFRAGEVTGLRAQVQALLDEEGAGEGE